MSRTLPTENGKGGVHAVARWVKKPVLLQLWFRLQLGLGFDPWPGNLQMPWMRGRKEGRKGGRKKLEKDTIRYHLCVECKNGYK